MGLMRKVNILVLGLAVLLAVACGKDKDPEPDTSKSDKLTGNCRLTSTRILVQGYDNGEEFIYDAQGKVIKVLQLANNTPWPGSYKEVEYNQAGQVIKISKFTAGNLDEFKTYFYNSLGQVEMEKEFFIATNNPPAVVRQIRQRTFTYNAANQLLRAVNMDVQNSDSATSYSNYFYPSANTARQEIANGTSPVHLIFEFTFDDKKTPATALPLPGYLVEHGFPGHNFLNLKITEVYNGNKIENHYYNYQYNAEGYPVSRTETNTYNNIVAITSYTYTCP